MTQNFAERLGWIPKSEDLRMSMGRALNYAQERKHSEVTLEHFLLALVDDPNSGAVFAACNVDPERLRADLTGFISNELAHLVMANEGVAQPSEGFKKVMAHASAAAEQSQREYVDGAIVLAALIGEGQSRAAQILNTYGLTFEVAVSSLKNANVIAGGQASRPQQAPSVEQNRAAPPQNMQQQPMVQREAGQINQQPPAGGNGAGNAGGQRSGPGVPGGHPGGGHPGSGHPPGSGQSGSSQGDGIPGRPAPQRPPQQQQPQQLAPPQQPLETGLNGVGHAPQNPPVGQDRGQPPAQIAERGQVPGQVNGATAPEGISGGQGEAVSPEARRREPEPVKDMAPQSQEMSKADGPSAFETGLTGFPDSAQQQNAPSENNDADKSSAESGKEQIPGEATVEDILASVREIIGAEDDVSAPASGDGSTTPDVKGAAAESAFAQGNFPSMDQSPPGRTETPKLGDKIQDAVGAQVDAALGDDSLADDALAEMEAPLETETPQIGRPPASASEFASNWPDKLPEQPQPTQQKAASEPPVEASQKRAAPEAGGFPPPPVGGGQQQRSATPPPPGQDDNSRRAGHRDVPPPPAPHQQQGGFDRPAPPPRPNQQQPFPPGGGMAPNMPAGNRGAPPPPHPQGQHQGHPPPPGGGMQPPQGQGRPGQPPMQGNPMQDGQQPQMSGGAPAQNVSKGQLIETIPRLMRMGLPVRVEVRMARAEVQDVERGLLGNSAPVRHDVMVTEAMTVRLSAPKGGFIIEPNSPETQWIDNRLGAHGENFASWSWTITPVKRGKRPLQLGISARIAGEQGVMAQSALPEQVVSVNVRVNYVQTLKWAAGWLVVAMLGGAVGKYGEHLLELANLTP